MQRQIPPEGHVALAKRPRILPVVERRVVVPAFVAFIRVTSDFGLSGCTLGSGPCHALRSNRFSVRRSQRAWCAGSRRTTIPLAWPRPRTPSASRDTLGRAIELHRKHPNAARARRRSLRDFHTLASGGPSNVSETGKSRTSSGSRPRSEKRRGRFGPIADVRPSDCCLTAR